MLTRQLLTDTNLPYIIVDMIVLHTRVDRRPLLSSGNGVGTVASSIDRQKHAHGRGGMHTIRRTCAVCAHGCTVLLSLHPVTKIKTTKINSDSYFRLFTKIGTPENYPPYGIQYVHSARATNLDDGRWMMGGGQEGHLSNPIFITKVPPYQPDLE